ncbi:hypothetical protein BDM02DRAFT_3092791 [Thelephora ganbajun]|uniref:Uncharacterized protein n=1 Tax=Thelephora ganbajun TaxID=370292 RepID=A0ACB6ZM02_THEGA|nr:hypothetical protein BDM02DRAFT_3092791 [Thelephora ganbajun]
MSFLGRNPRYVLALLVLLFFTSILLFNNNLGGDTWPNVNAFSRSGRVATIDFLRQTEAGYQQNVIRGRQDLIRKHGSSASKVNPWPLKEWGYYTLWDFFIPGFQCPHRTARIGTMGDGGKWVCGLEHIQKKKKCVIYSFGINGESSFEAELLEKAPGCEVWGYDFSVSGWGPELKSYPHRAHFEPWALGPVDNHGSSMDVKMWSLRGLMEHNGHDFIDILKVDIEGAEFASLATFFDFYEYDFAGKPLPIGQLQIELHPREISRDYSGFSAFLAWWEKVERLGLRPFWTEPNLVYVHLTGSRRPDLTEYSFINIRGNHELIIGDSNEIGPQ